jgi:MFS family permease
LVSALVFLFADGTGSLLIGRATNGFAAGLGAGALTAWITELEPDKDRARAAVVASAANLGGLAVGGLLSGLLAQYIPAPLRTIFVVYVSVLLIVSILLFRVKETVRSLQVMSEIAPQERRAELVSAYLLMCYLGNSLPVLGVGLLTTILEPQKAHAIIAAVIAALSLAAILTGAASRKRRQQVRNEPATRAASNRHWNNRTAERPRVHVDASGHR